MRTLPSTRLVSGVRIVVAMLVTFTLVGCESASRPKLTDEELRQRVIANEARTADVYREAIGRMIERVEREHDWHASGGEPPIIDILAISGGGDSGAFGAGFLVGWKSVTDPGHTLPEFDAVTGVSTGALIAPFIFLGDAARIQLVEDFYRNPRRDWTRRRGLLDILGGSPSLLTIPGLDRDVRAIIDAEFVRDIAARASQGRLLIISATDIDLGVQRFWDVGDVAQTNPDQPARVQDIMLASAAIPVAFPPITMDNALYADGGVTANVFVRLDPRSPNGLIARWRAAHPNRPLPRVRYWIIFNNQMAQIPAVVQPQWRSIIGPSLATSIRYATLAEIRWLAAIADYSNATLGTDIEVRVVSIPDEWRPPVPGQFQKETMRSLSDLGRTMGVDPASWRLWTEPVRD